MTRYTPDGGIVPSHIKVGERSGPEEHDEMLGLYRGFVQRVVRATDDNNQTGRLEYVVTVQGQDYPGALDMTGPGGIYQNAMRIRKGAQVASESGAPGPVLDSTYEEKKDGEIVFVMFLDGDCPIIIGGDRHPLVDTVNKDYDEPEGMFDRFEWNGIEFLTDKDGNYTISQIGLKDPATNQVTNPTSVGSVFTFNADGDFSFLTAGGTLVAIANADDSIELTCADGDTIKVSKADGIQMSTPAGGGTSVSLKNGNVAFTAGADFTIDGSGGKGKFSGGKVGFGSDAFELLDLFDKALEQVSILAEKSASMATDDSTHIHGSSVGPTSPPTTASAYVTLAADFTAAKVAIELIKTNLGTIKGGV